MITAILESRNAEYVRDRINDGSASKPGVISEGQTEQAQMLKDLLEEADGNSR